MNLEHGPSKLLRRKEAPPAPPWSISPQAGAASHIRLASPLGASLAGWPARPFASERPQSARSRSSQAIGGVSGLTAKANLPDRLPEGFHGGTVLTGARRACILSWSATRTCGPLTLILCG